MVIVDAARTAVDARTAHRLLFWRYIPYPPLGLLTRYWAWVAWSPRLIHASIDHMSPRSVVALVPPIPAAEVGLTCRDPSGLPGTKLGCALTGLVPVADILFPWPVRSGKLPTASPRCQNAAGESASTAVSYAVATTTLLAPYACYVVDTASVHGAQGCGLCFAPWESSL